MLFYDLVKNNLKHLSLQTALLEACDWDEDILEDQLQFVQSFLTNWNPSKSCKNWEHVRTDMVEEIQNSYYEYFGYNNKPFLDIIIKVIEHHRDEILQHFALGENCTRLKFEQDGAINDN